MTARRVDQSALDACRAFIHDTATAALDGLDAQGMVDPTVRIPFEVYVALAGQITPPLPLFYVKIGAHGDACARGRLRPHLSGARYGMAVTVVTC